MPQSQCGETGRLLRGPRDRGSDSGLSVAEPGKFRPMTALIRVRGQGMWCLVSLCRELYEYGAALCVMGHRPNQPARRGWRKRNWKWKRAKGILGAVHGLHQNREVFFRRM